jgi:hypothetical protein
MSSLDKIQFHLAQPARLLTNQEKFLASILIGLFIFLFLLFFQPFGVNNYDPLERISFEFFVIMLCMGAYVTIIILLNDPLLFDIVFKKLIKRWQLYLWLVWSVIYVSTMLFLLYNVLGEWHDFRLSSWLEFIGNFSITSIIPLIVISMYVRMQHLRELSGTTSDYSSEGASLITFPSDNQKDVMTIPLRDILYLESEDNYVAVHYVKSGKQASSLVRITLKRIDDLQLHPAICRCHRSYLINLFNLSQFKGNSQQGLLYLHHLEEPLPVSKSYASRLMDQLK